MVTTAYSIQPRLMMSDATVNFTFMSPGETQTSETDVSVAAICTQPTLTDDGKHGIHQNSVKYVNPECKCR